MNSLSQFHQNHGVELEEIKGITIPIRYINRFREERQTLRHRVQAEGRQPGSSNGVLAEP